MPELRLKGRVDLDGSRFTAGLRNMNKEASDFSKGLGGISGALKGIAGGFGITTLIASLTAGFKSFVDEGGRMQDAVDRTDIGAAKLLELQRVAKNSGASLEEFLVFYKRLKISQFEATEGNEETIDSFKRLGITVEDLKSKSTESLMDKVFGNLKGSKFGPDILASLVDVGGKSADNLIPSIKAGFEEIGVDAKRMTATATKELDQLGDNTANTWHKIRNFFRPFAAGVAVTLNHPGSKKQDWASFADLDGRFAEATGKAPAKQESAMRETKAERKSRIESEKKAKEEAEKKQKSINKLSEELSEMESKRMLGRLTLEQQIIYLKEKQIAIEKEAIELQMIDREASLKKFLEVEIIAAKLASMPRMESGRAAASFRYSGGYTPSPMMLNDPAAASVRKSVASLLEQINNSIQSQTSVIQSKESPF